MDTKKQYTQAELDELQIWDVYPYIGDAVYEVTEVNGNSLTVAVVSDILWDFGQFPKGITHEQREAVIARLAKQYVG